jgi:hypothetical protein
VPKNNMNTMIVKAVQIFHLFMPLIKFNILVNVLSYSFEWQKLNLFNTLNKIQNPKSIHQDVRVNVMVGMKINQNRQSC